MLTIASPGGAEQSASLLFPRLRALALSDSLTDAQRAAIRAAVPLTLEQLIASVTLAMEACDGPDPEMALLYALDAAGAAIAEFSALDASLT